MGVGLPASVVCHYGDLDEDLDDFLADEVAPPAVEEEPVDEVPAAEEEEALARNLRSVGSRSQRSRSQPYESTRGNE